ncbi:uncharacterized protein Z519_08098 [Cladophialophora bantiana CBS 173.52]|uniref:Zn(2)-C6 fungal-type domain-containing protein n=1 Tax=Cladophialophora bantiana (strain ATCC 10958 / CBS 173.52 / CDC B-1940 / NIH 8579) TaxID=1442370 RepID=A0A0D2FXI4_CLAB1|nr:uncharacterized protein Z519_08098 [Cladophialophora bantiana CBS 173.52]KIW91202.1 hypothetical protein Z519_08098 [Cladophialophora bantiana CBS 173.52]
MEAGEDGASLSPDPRPLTGVSPLHSRALISCSFCRKRKRKCDKTLPDCSFCRRHRRRCVYPQRRAPLLTVEEVSLSPSAKTHVEPHPSEAVVVYFLDHNIFRCGQMVVTDVHPAVPESVLSLLGDFASVQKDAAEYFRTVHCWWSIISKHSFYNQLLNPLVPRQGDVSLLLLCMKLIIWRPSEERQDPRTALYLAAKHYSTELEVAGVFSIRGLQAAVLIAVYEYAHGIYPSAFLSVASCARYGRALDINLTLTDTSGVTMDCFGSEEKRRLWWAILILDRFANISGPGRRDFEIDDPSPRDLLPADDAAWDAGMVTAYDGMTISCPSTERMGRFAKLAQATHLLCRVLRHVGDRAMDPEFRESQERQLEKAIQMSIRMVSGVLKGPAGAHAQICYRGSSLFVLYDDAFNIEPSTPAELIRRDHARDLLERVSKTCSTSSGHFLQGNALPVEMVAPFVLHWKYRAASFYVRMGRESSNSDHARNLEILKMGLKKLDARWKIAGI